MWLAGTVSRGRRLPGQDGEGTGQVVGPWRPQCGMWHFPVSSGKPAKDLKQGKYVIFSVLTASGGRTEGVEAGEQDGRRCTR